MKKILIVDDEAIALERLETILEKEGYVVIKAADGKQAWDILQEDKDIELVLLDRMMPNMDGMELIGKIKKDDILKDLPVILQTGLDKEKDVIAASRSGAYYYLVNWSSIPWT